jgi:hypothetical protein
MDGNHRRAELVGCVFATQQDEKTAGGKIKREREKKKHVEAMKNM